MSRFLVNPFSVIPSGPPVVTGFGTKLANYFTQSASNGSDWTSTGSTVFIAGTHNVTTTGLSAHSFNDSSGWGTRYANMSGTTFNVNCFAPKIRPNDNSRLIVMRRSPTYAYGINYTEGSGWGSTFTAPTAWSLGTNQNGRDMAFTSDGNVAFSTLNQSPYLKAWTFSSSGYGTLYANMATAPLNVFSITVNSTDNVVVGDTNSTSELAAFAWSGSGWGSKYANPSTGKTSAVGAQGGAKFTADDAAVIVPTGAGVAGQPQMQAFAWSGSSWGTRYTDASSMATGVCGGATITPNKNVYAVAYNASPYIAMWQWNNATGFGTKASAPASPPSSVGLNASFSPSENWLLVNHSFSVTGASMYPTVKT